MPSINSYLNFAGNTEDAFKFYQSVFRWRIKHHAFQRYSLQALMCRQR
jgi:uncharacterized glyoxalase superfamily protein PhnB